MDVELSRQTKDRVVRHLSAYGRLNQFLPSSAIYAMQVPANPSYPFLRYSPVSSLPHESSCWVGTVTRLDLNLFVEGDDAEAGETRLLRIKSLVVEAMASLGKAGNMLSVDYLGSRDMMADEEADRWRSIIEYRVTAVVRKA